jgi:hypothetical protein
VEDKVNTADDLRSGIRQAELFAANIRAGTPPDELLGFLEHLDALTVGVEQLEQKGVDLRAEKTRLDTVHRIVESKDRIIVRALTPQGGLAAARAKGNPSRDRHWWYLDQRVAQSRAQRLRRIGWVSLVAVVILAILIPLYIRFLRPDEATRQRIEFEFSGDASIQSGDYEAALQAYESALEIAPDDPDINMMVGVLYEATGQPEKAATPYQRAEELYGSRVTLLAMRAQQYSSLGWYDRAETDAVEAIELDDQFALAYCSLGSSLEGQDMIAQGVAAYQACADLAREQEQNELYVIATTRMAYLMQRPVQ